MEASSHESLPRPTRSRRSTTMSTLRGTTRRRTRQSQRSVFPPSPLCYIVYPSTKSTWRFVILDRGSHKYHTTNDHTFGLCSSQLVCFAVSNSCGPGAFRSISSSLRPSSTTSSAPCQSSSFPTSLPPLRSPESHRAVPSSSSPLESRRWSVVRPPMCPRQLESRGWSPAEPLLGTLQPQQCRKIAVHVSGTWFMVPPQIKSVDGSFNNLPHPCQVPPVNVEHSNLVAV